MFNIFECFFLVENNKDVFFSVNVFYYINSLSKKELFLSDMYFFNIVSSDIEIEVMNENNSECIIESSEFE